METNLEQVELCCGKKIKCPLVDELRELRKENQRLERMVHIDSLTGLNNFHCLHETLEGEMERTRRSGLPTGLIMIDLDHFKQVNDTFGHEAGNTSLRWVADIWKKNIRRIDIAVRYGGEEFVIILPGTDLEQSVLAAERLRAALAGSPVILNGDKVLLTASCGIEVYGGERQLSVEGFIKRADDFLFEAKKSGRNCLKYNKKKSLDAETEVSTTERVSLIKSARS